jgi:hypothetical protein
MKALFIGAGASCGTFKDTPGCPPEAKYFGKALEEAAPSWELEYLGLRDVVTHLGRPLHELSMVEIWTCIDYYAKLGTVLPQWPQWDPLATRDLKRALLLLYGSRCDELADQLVVSSDYSLGRIVSELSPGDVLVSFNYDTIVERLAAKFHHDVRSAFSACDKGTVRLAKPHGSVSWRMEWATRRVEWLGPGGGPMLNAMKPEQVGPEAEPLVLGAVPIKSELIREVQRFCGWSEVFEVVAAQWKLIAHAVQHAESFVVVGYSFPEEGASGYLVAPGAKSRPPQWK